MSKILARDLRRPVYALDLRNHGASPQAEEHTYMAMAEDVEEFIQEHGLRGSAVIGHSMGAKTAMTLALHRPELVGRLIPVDNAPVDAALKNDFGKYVQGMRKVEDAEVSSLKEADEILRPFEESLAVRQFLLANMVGGSGGKKKFGIPLKTLAKALDHMADFPYKNPDEARYEEPTLIVRGTESHYVPDETLPVIGRFFPRFELKDIKAGHWVISENPMAFRDGKWVRAPCFVWLIVLVVVDFLSTKD